MRLLVIGATGQVAQSLASLNGSEPGLEVVVLGRPQLDVTQPDTIAAAITTNHPDCIVNAAAYTAVDKAEQEIEAAYAVNASGAGHVARCAAAAGRPLIHLSTDYVFDGRKATSYVECDPVNPLNVYGASKEEGERQVRSEHAGALILRTSWVYSVYGSNFVRTMLRLAASNETLKIVGDQTGCPTSANDIARACLACARRLIAEPGNPDLNGIFHFCNDTALTWAQFAERIFDLAGDPAIRETNVERITTEAFGAPAARPANSVLATRKFRDTFGLTPATLQESLQEFFSLYQPS